MATAMAEAETRQKLLRNVKKEVKQIMEEAVTRKFVHEDSSHIISFCAAVEACVLHRLKRRAAGFLRSNKVAALFLKVGKSYGPALQLCRKAQELEQIIDNNRRNQASRNHEVAQKPTKSPSVSPQAARHLWIRTALMEKVLDKVVLYLVENSSKFYEKEAVLMDPVDGPILASLLVGPCALEYTKMKTADHFWTDPSADELVQRHRIHSALCRQDSPTKRPALCIQKRQSSGSMEERPLLSARDYVESLHQNSRATLLYGKNNVLVQPRDDMEAIPGYLSLHQTAEVMTLKWTPNQLMKGSVGDVEYERSVYWDYTMTIRLEEIVYLHCHQQVDSGGTVVLVSQDGVQLPPLRFPRGGHLLQFLSCLETGLLPHGQLDPPLWSQRGKGKVFPKLRKRSPHGSSESVSDKEEDEAADYVFRILFPGSQSEFVAPDLMDQGAVLWQPTPRKSSCSSCSQNGSSDGMPANGCNHDRAPLKLLCDTMKYQIISRAFYGWLAYCRHLSTVRTHLSALVNPTIVYPDVPCDGGGGLSAEVWQQFLQDCTAYEEAELLRLVYYGGVEPELRREVWPFLLGHYRFGMSEADRKEVDEQVRACYEQTMSEWLGCEAIVRQREKEQHAAALARCLSGGGSDKVPQKTTHRDSTVSTESSQSSSSDRQGRGRLQSSSSSSTQVFESVDQIEMQLKNEDSKSVSKILNGVSTSKALQNGEAMNKALQNGVPASKAVPNGVLPNEPLSNGLLPNEALQKRISSPESGHPPSSNFPVTSVLLYSCLQPEETLPAVAEPHTPPKEKGPPANATSQREDNISGDNGAEDAAVGSETPETRESENLEVAKVTERAAASNSETIESIDLEMRVSTVSAGEEAKSTENDKHNISETEETNSIGMGQVAKASETEETTFKSIGEAKVSETEDTKSTGLEETKASETEEVTFTSIGDAKASETEDIKSTGIEETKASETEDTKSTGMEETKASETEEATFTSMGQTKVSETDEIKSTGIKEAAKASETEEVTFTSIGEVKASETEDTKSTGMEKTKASETEEVIFTSMGQTKATETEEIKSTGIEEAAKISETEEATFTSIGEAKASETEDTKSLKLGETKASKIMETKLSEMGQPIISDIGESKTPEIGQTSIDRTKSLEVTDVNVLEETKAPEVENGNLSENEEMTVQEIRDAKMCEITEVSSSTTGEAEVSEIEETELPHVTEAKTCDTEETKSSGTTETKVSETGVPKSPETGEIRVSETGDTEAQEMEEMKISEKEETIVSETEEIKCKESGNVNNSDMTNAKSTEMVEGKVFEMGQARGLLMEGSESPKLGKSQVFDMEESKSLEIVEVKVFGTDKPIVLDTGKAKVLEMEGIKPKSTDTKMFEMEEVTTLEMEEPQSRGIKISSGTMETKVCPAIVDDSDDSPSALEMEEIPTGRVSVASWDRQVLLEIHQKPIRPLSPTKTTHLGGGAEVLGVGLPVLELRLERERRDEPDVSSEVSEPVLSEEEPEMESLFPQLDSLAICGELGTDATSPASSIGTTYSQELLDLYTVNLHRIEKDVQRCDRTYWYFTPANLDKLRNIMCSYVWQHLDIGYVQGMCDLLAPLLVILDDEALAFSCFSQLMKRMNQNFPHGGVMDTHFANMRSLIQILDSELFELMQQNGDYTHFYFCYRWFLLDFKRELVYEDVFSVWETIWAARQVSSGHFVLFIALALVEIYRDIILENNMDFTDIIKFFNEMAERHNVSEVLALARDLVYKVQTLIENK
ncbi:small G protein signaling modulator 1-like [Megalops cyprinoides]|uniref:small G protein signaling modulator 1-like n=1 Tax=Megalops cyprinoides TaxID=118141 RepID=UPI001864D669|nr:small G protein signaling modulator 1-like [Megalops cyprinoides]